MDLLVQDFPFSNIASDLNEKGFRTREGKMWSQVSIFNMLPRLIEVGPRLFSTEEWKRAVTSSGNRPKPLDAARPGRASCSVRDTASGKP